MRVPAAWCMWCGGALLVRDSASTTGVPLPPREYRGVHEVPRLDEPSHRASVVEPFPCSLVCSI